MGIGQLYIVVFLFAIFAFNPYSCVFSQELDIAFADDNEEPSESGKFVKHHVFESVVLDMRSTISVLQGEVAALKESVSRLQTSNQNLLNSVSVLETENINIQEDMIRLNSTIQSTYSVTETLKKDNQIFVEDINRLNKTQENLVTQSKSDVENLNDTQKKLFSNLDLRNYLLLEKLNTLNQTQINSATHFESENRIIRMDMMNLNLTSSDAQKSYDNKLKLILNDIGKLNETQRQLSAALETQGLILNGSLPVLREELLRLNQTQRNFMKKLETECKENQNEISILNQTQQSSSKTINEKLESFSTEFTALNETQQHLKKELKMLTSENDDLQNNITTIMETMKIDLGNMNIETIWIYINELNQTLQKSIQELNNLQTKYDNNQINITNQIFKFHSSMLTLKIEQENIQLYFRKLNGTLQNLTNAVETLESNNANLFQNVEMLNSTHFDAFKALKVDITVLRTDIGKLNQSITTCLISCNSTCKGDTSDEIKPTTTEETTTTTDAKFGTTDAKNKVTDAKTIATTAKSAEATMSPGTDTTHAEFSCDFENTENPLCGFTQNDTVDIHWTRHQGNTPTRNTGPWGDHTTEAGNGYYVYTEACSGCLENEARLITPMLLSTASQCLRFYVHMLDTSDYGDHMGTLKIYKRTELTDQEIWKQEGSQDYIYHHPDENWREIVVQFSSQSNYQIVFEGTIGSGIRSDIAIDDVTIKNGSCN